MMGLFLTPLECISRVTQTSALVFRLKRRTKEGRNSGFSFFDFIKLYCLHYMTSEGNPCLPQGALTRQKKIGERCWCSVAQSCLTFCQSMGCSTPVFSVLHYLPEFAQTRVHWLGDANQPSHSLSPPSPLAFYLSQHQGLFQWVGSVLSTQRMKKRKKKMWILFFIETSKGILFSIFMETSIPD